jgi:hypothetical protein
MAEQLKHNSPDETKYHQSSDIPGTMLPRAAKDGQSMAFDPNQPQTVIVDPGEAGGGFSVDMASFANIKGEFNKSAGKKETLQDPTNFYRQVSELTKSSLKETKKPAKVSTVSSSEYKPISPLEKLSSGAPDIAAVSATVNDLVAEEKKRAEGADTMREQVNRRLELPDSSHPGFVAGPDPQILAMLDRQSEALNQVISVVNTLSTSHQDKKTFAKEAEEAVSSTPTNAEFEEPPKRQPTNIPFLDADKPGRPKYETYFEMSKMGTMAARYHAVVEGKDCLGLIYDTRFEDGFQYLPPNLGEERITITVPELGNKAYTCSSLGLNWSIGCLDVVILIKHGDGE